MIFFNNFLALIIKAEVVDPDSNGAVVYSVGLITVNILFGLSVWWNTWASIKTTFVQVHA